MPVKKQTPESADIYFITFTCCHWLPLFALLNAYDTVYKWFDYLKAQYYHVLGYVIMPNHLHVVVCFSENQLAANKIVSNAKRFMAYEIVKRLQLGGHTGILEELQHAVNDSDKRRGKLHQVFEPSFDWKECRTEKFIRQKLNYMHKNPVSGKWNLCQSPIEYRHSSAIYYYTGKQGVYPVLNYAELNDMEWRGH